MRAAICVLFCVGTLSAADVPADPKYVAAVAELDSFIRHECHQKKLPALAIALVDDQRVVWSAGFGFVDEKKLKKVSADTCFGVGDRFAFSSCVDTARLIEDGKISLDTPLSKIIPEFAMNSFEGSPITIRQLLSHRSGLPRFTVDQNRLKLTADKAVVVRDFTTFRPMMRPGSAHKYSNSNYTLLQDVARKLYESKDSSRIAPGAFQTASEELLRVRDVCHGSVCTLFERRFNVTSEVRWFVSATSMSELLTRVYSQTLLKPSTLDLMMTPADGGADGYGLGFDMSHLGGRRMFEHVEGVFGVTACMAGLPDEKLGVAMITNRENAAALMNRIGKEALTLLAAVKDGSPLPKIIASTAVDWKTCQLQPGYYAIDDGKKPALRIERYQDRAFLWQLTGGAPAEIRQVRDSLQTDDITNFGTKLEDVSPQSLRIDDLVYRRLPDAMPADVPERWRGLLGEYGFDAHWLIILEEAGRLYALMDWHYLEPLKPVKDDEFVFLSTGRYASESVTFHRDEQGRSTDVTISGMKYPRRKFDGDGGTYRIQPVRPVDVLMKEAVAATPPAPKGELATPDLVDLSTLDSTLKFDIRYATADNFLGTPVYPVARALLQRPATEALVKTHRELARDGYGLLIHDAYRPWHVTKVFWEATPQSQHTFVADPALGSRHNRGCAVDLTLYELKTGRAVIMPGGYDEFSDRSYPRYPGGTSRQRFLRDKLRTAMESNGFNVYEAEWWHFDFRDWKSYPIMNVALSDFKR